MGRENDAGGVSGRPPAPREKELLLFLLEAGDFRDSEILVEQVSQCLVHEVDPGRYLELTVAAPCQPVSSRWTGLYANAFAPLTETECVEAILRLTNGRLSSLELCYSPDHQIDSLPVIEQWKHL